MFPYFISVLSSFLTVYFFFFFNDTATTEIYTLSLHDALPIYTGVGKTVVTAALAARAVGRVAVVKPAQTGVTADEPGDLQEVQRLTGLDDLHEEIGRAHV